MMKRLKVELTVMLLRLLWDNRGGLGQGGPGTNTIRDIINTINGGGGVPSLPLNSVQFHNPTNAFDGDDNFRFIAGSGVLIGQDTKLNLSENGGPADVYDQYKSSNDYREFYCDGKIRLQI